MKLKNMLQEDSWKDLLADEFCEDYWSDLESFLADEQQRYEIYPESALIFNALNRTPVNSVRAVILGQDPYHGVGQAHGLSFSVREGIRLPASLRNIYKELQQDLKLAPAASGDLSHWAAQGVLLLNTSLTVRAGEANSHAGRGWETFTDAVIKKLSDNTCNRVFILWGKHAQTKAVLIDESHHLVLEAAHPSPLSAYRGFFGCRHFSKCNAYLSRHKIKPIDWSLS